MFIGPDKLFQIEGFYLKSAAYEPSFTREILSTAVTKSMLSPVARLSYTMLYINQQCFGLYLIIEDVDTQFLKSRFDDDSGALYKCCGELQYVGTDVNVYKNLTCGNALMYEPQTVTMHI